MIDVAEKIHELAKEASARDYYINGADDDQIQEVLDAIADQEPSEPAELEFEGDAYNYDLINWVAEDIRRGYLCDDVMQEFGSSELGFFNIIREAQVHELREIAETIWSDLEEQAQEMIEEEEEEEE